MTCLMLIVLIMKKKKEKSEISHYIYVRYILWYWNPLFGLGLVHNEYTVSSKTYDNWGDFNFEIVYFSLDGDFPSSFLRCIYFEAYSFCGSIF